MDRQHALTASTFGWLEVMTAGLFAVVGSLGKGGKESR
jgi:hypothetical protein